MSGNFKLNKVMSGKRFYYIVESNFKSTFEEITREIQNKFKIRMPNRDLIVKSLISFLVHGDYKDFKIPKINLILFRSDIKNFYPSIDKHILYKKLNSSNILSYETMLLLKKIIFNNRISGVPLGLSFSNHLAELFLENFDNDVHVNIEPVVYFRYIDDLIYIKYCDFIDENQRYEHFKENERELMTLLSKYNLTLNQSKTISSFYIYNDKMLNKNSNLDFIYLGYHFQTIDESLKIKISDKKLKKYSNRLNGYFYEFRKGKRRDIDFWRLYYKLLNGLFGITIIDKKHRKMKSGMAYHYRYVNDYSNLDGFINHFKKTIFSLKLNAKYTAILLNIFSDGRGKNFMRKRYDYLKLTNNQMNTIRNRLHIQYRGFNKEKFIRDMFYSLYK
nr:RNA-directed DNA polymerase [Lysinibacillus sphaericus]